MTLFYNIWNDFKAVDSIFQVNIKDWTRRTLENTNHLKFLKIVKPTNFKTSSSYWFIKQIIFDVDFCQEWVNIMNLPSFNSVGINLYSNQFYWPHNTGANFFFLILNPNSIIHSFTHWLIKVEKLHL